MLKFFDYAKVLEPYSEELKNSLEQCLSHSRFINGDEVALFEKEFAKKNNSKYAVGVSSGTDALIAILMSLDLPKGSEIIVPSFTFIATASSILRCGYKPIFVDLQKDSFVASFSDIKKNINKNTSAIIFVHLFGEFTDLSELKKISEENNIALIEDCAQAFGTPVGNWGIASAYSFFPAKNLGCLGDGGAITTNNYDLYNKLQKIKKHGTEKAYEYEFLGGNFRLDTLQAAFLSVLIQDFDSWILKRRNNAKKYIDSLSYINNLKLPTYNNKSSFNQFTIRTNKRNKLKKFLNEKGVPSNIYYPAPLHNNKIFNCSIDLIETEKRCKESLSIPIYQGLEEEEIGYIIHQIQTFFKEDK